VHDGVMRQGTKYETTSVGQVKQNLHTVLTIKCIWNVSTSNISAFQVIPTTELCKLLVQ